MTHREKGEPAGMTIQERLARHLGRTPDTSGSIFIAAGATIEGDVVLGPRTSVFHGAVLRGDINVIRVGEGTNIQDNAVVHLADELGAHIGAWCTIGHGANSLVAQRFECPAGSLVYGSPARVVRPLTAEEQKGLRASAEKYVKVARAHAARAAGR
jgi:gamma-carbonic anhydrase